LKKSIFNRLFVNKNQKWTLYAQMSRLIYGFAFIAILAKALPSNLLGYWYLFLSMFGVVTLVEMGLVQVMGRHAAYLKADFESGRKRASDFMNFVKVGERLYVSLVLVVVSLALPIGLWWLNYSQEVEIKFSSLTLAWFIYVLGGGLSILAAYYVALVSGAGKLWITQKITIISIIVNAIVLLSVFLTPPTLLIPAISMMLAQLWLVISARNNLFRLDIAQKGDSSSKLRMRRVKVQLRIIGKDTARMFLVMIYYHLLTNGFLLVLSSSLPISEVASYGLMMQLVNIVISISIVWAKSNFYDMASNHRDSNARKLRSIFFSGFVRSVTVSMLGFLGAMLIAPTMLSLLGSKTNLPEKAIMLVILSCFWIEFVITQFSQMLIARGDMRVAYYSVFSAILILLNTVILLNYGASLSEVFINRIVVYVLGIGIPVILMSRKTLRAPIVAR